VEKTKIKQEADHCPKCGASDNKMLYDRRIADDDSVGIGYEYNCLECGFEGQEWHKLVFDIHTDKEGIPIEP
jgi:Zn ribbon nucleic-acid-binding protein